MTKRTEKVMEFIRKAFLYGKDFCEDTAENLKETVVTAVDSAKLQYRINSQRNELNALYATLGKILCNETLSEGGREEASAEEINGLCMRIKAKETLLDGLQKQLRIVCGKVICPGCGKFMSEKYVYCPWCGRATSIEAEYEESDISSDELDDVREIDEI